MNSYNLWRLDYAIPHNLSPFLNHNYTKRLNTKYKLKVNHKQGEYTWIKLLMTIMNKAIYLICLMSRHKKPVGSLNTRTNAVILVESFLIIACVRPSQGINNFFKS
jgi:hypothetical protein